MNDHETQSWMTTCEHEHDPAQTSCDGDDESNAISRRSSSICEIQEEDEEDATPSIGIGSSSSGIPIHRVRELREGKRYFPMQSIKEEQQSSPNYSDNSYNYGSGGDDLVDCVYVAVGKSESSMDALKFAVKQVLSSMSSSSNANNTILYLIHVYSEIKYIPSPLGKLPKSQVSSEQVESYMTQESGKRRQLLQKFLDTCNQAQVTVDTLLIESDMIGKAIVDLIPILNIRKLVLGTNKNNLRKLISRKGNGIADHILQNAPEGCDIKIICEGNEVMVNDSVVLSSPRSINIANNSDDNSKPNTLSPRRNYKDPKFIVSAEDPSDEAVSCMCFKPKRSL